MPVTRTIALALALALLVGCASTGSVRGGQALAADSLQRRFSAFEIASLLRAEGYGTVEEIGDEAVRFKAAGMSYVLTIYDDGDLQLYFGLTGIEVAPEVVNEWNRTRRLTRAYLDSESDPVLESDLLSDAGLSPAMLARWVQVFVQGAGLYHAFLLEHGTLDPLPANADPAAI
ncbi:MAG: YbjN domain-containing protein [Myxococcota bacterium]